MKKIKQEFLNKKGFVVHTPTREKMEDVSRAFGDVNLGLNFDSYGSESCVSHNYNGFLSVAYGSIGFYRENGAIVYNYDEIWEEKPIKLEDFEFGKIYEHEGDEYYFRVRKYGSYEAKPKNLSKNHWLNIRLQKEMLDWEFEEVELSFIDKIKDGDRYYYIDSDGKIECSYWANHPVDERRCKIGNVFETEEEAEKFEIKIQEREEIKC